MELESLFSSTRWEILKAVSKHKLSPMELAEKLNSTSANISQQLRLLELAGLVKSERLSNVERGKPRIVYSLAGDNAYLILLSRNYTDKKMMALTSYHKFTLKTWFLDNVEHHKKLVKVYSELEKYIDTIEIIAIDPSFSSFILYLVVDSKSEPSIKKVLHGYKVHFVSLSELRKKNVVILHDPENKYSEVVEYG